jgi:hypothetical protein
MEARAIAVGAPKMHYLWPDTHYIGRDLNASELSHAAGLGLKDRIVMDVHTGATGGVALARTFFNNASDSLGGAGAMNCEVNAQFHGFQRALTEALDLNSFLNFSPQSTSGESLYKMKGRMASFCFERSGGDYSDNRYTQGLAYFSADKMWLQPGGYVHKMYHDSWLPLTANATLLGNGQIGSSQCALIGKRCTPTWMHQFSDISPGFCCNTSTSMLSAAFSEDRSEVSLRFVNPSNASSVLLATEVSGAGWTLVNVTQLTHTDLLDANPANDTLRLTPSLVAHDHNIFVAPPQSVSVACFARAGPDHDI